MKKITTIIAVMFCLSASAQVDTVKAAIFIKPILVNAMTKDTAYQLTWSAFGVSNDTTQGCTTYVQMFNARAKKVLEFNCAIPSSIKNKWGLNDDIITDYIFLTYGITKK